MLLTGGTVGRGERGREGVRGVQYTATRVKCGQGIAPRHKGGISKSVGENLPGGEGWDSRQKWVIRKGLRACTFMYILC
jgi:hypothetical protein